MHSCDKKVKLGQFFTKGSIWLKPQIIDFIKKTGLKRLYDPFAGQGDILNALNSILKFDCTIGLDIDESLSWTFNDSLINIPHEEDAVLVTNPPYISNYSAARKGIDLSKYFSLTQYDDVYLLALDKMLEAQKNVVAIVPETFINSNYKQKNKLCSITILEENPFDDTDAPVVVACFDSVDKELDKVLIYKNDEYIMNYKDLNSIRLIPHNSVKMKFNDKKGWLAVRCVDSTNPEYMLEFGTKETIEYDWENGIKVSSRLYTLIDVECVEEKRALLIKECNDLLKKLRNDSKDIVFSPFKGNMKNGVRRRRLDFATCRSLIEIAYKKIQGGK